MAIHMDNLVSMASQELLVRWFFGRAELCTSQAEAWPVFAALPKGGPRGWALLPTMGGASAVVLTSPHWRSCHVDTP